MKSVDQALYNHEKKMVELKIKNERNGLAHGTKSFRQSAEVVTIQELITIKETTISYLQDITDNIVKFIDKKEYRKNSVRCFIATATLEFFFTGSLRPIAASATF